MNRIFLRRLACLLPLLILSATTIRADVVQNLSPAVARLELRAFWADGFNEGYKTPQQIDTLLQRLHDAHCNAIFAQMRKGGDAYYASHYEPWASDDTRHFDALACLIEKAHKMQPRIAVHAWINTCAVGTGAKHPGFHVAQLHPEWMSVNARGRADDGEVRKIDPGNPDAADWTFRLYLDVVRHYDVDGIHFDFVRYGSPRFGYNPVSVQRFVTKSPPRPTAQLDKSRSLPLQQRVRGAEENEKIVLPLPTDPAWKQWRRDQVTALVRKVYAHAVALKPQIVVSAATIAWGNGPHNEIEWLQKSAAMNQVFQDWRSWLQEGCLDLACPMTYFGGRHGLEYEKTWSAWVKGRQYKRAATVAVGNWQLLPEQTLAQMRIARAPDTEGHTPYGVMLYSYAGTNLGAKPGKPGLHELELQPDFYALLSQPSAYAPVPPFAADVAPPPMPWKAEPTKGMLKGFVRSGRLAPLDGAHVTVQSTRNHRQWTQKTDGTGFYAFVDLPPDTYTVSAASATTAQTHWTVHSQQARIEAGKVATCTLDALDNAPDANTALQNRIETLDSVDAAIQRAQPAPVLSAPSPTATATPTPKQIRLRNLAVVLGTDTFPGNLYVRDASEKNGICLRVRLSRPPPVPFQPDDIIDAVGALSMIDGEPALENANACLNDITLESETIPLPVVPLRSLTDPTLANRGFARIRGRVVQSDANGFTLEAEKTDTEGAQARITLAGRKDFGVEAEGWAALRPSVGSVMEVTGLITTYAQAEHKTLSIRLIPRRAADITLITPPHAPGASHFWQAIAVLLALLLLALWFGRKRL